MIRQEDVYRIGRVVKSRGISGEVEISLVNDAFEHGGVNFLICCVEGILVPFYWEEYRFKNDLTAIFKFEGVDTDIAAKQLIGCEVYYPFLNLIDCHDHVLSWAFFVGYKVYDVDKGYIGNVLHVDESSANVLFTIQLPEGTEMLIPVHPDLICRIDNEKRLMEVKMPIGMFSL